jgi:hypothetical protein
LHQRGAPNRDICVDVEGAMLGPACVLVSRASNGFRGIERDDASTVLKCLLARIAIGIGCFGNATASPTRGV